ncbi:MAG TPA: ferredoxin, partial [Cupriavidus sp.]|nr:ferredoxin [Cupriavidus sp.]
MPRMYAAESALDHRTADPAPSGAPAAAPAETRTEAATRDL